MNLTVKNFKTSLLILKFHSDNYFKFKILLQRTVKSYQRVVIYYYF